MDKSILQLYERFCRALDTPRSLACFVLAKYGEWDQLVSLRVDPSNYCPFHSSIDRFRKDVQATEFLRKCQGVPTTVDRERAAVDGFIQAERVCALTTHRLRNNLANPSTSMALEWKFLELIEKAKSFLRKCLSDVPEHLNGRFGPGSTYESKAWRHRSITAFDKLRNSPLGTPACLELVDHLVWQTALKHAYGVSCENRLFDTVPGNRLTTVPKDCTKDRAIAVEPGLNVWAQLAVGSYLEKCLKRAGIPKHTGEQTHCRMAREASASGSHATIDLSSASDTLCTALVEILLPPDWYALLCQLRSPKTFVSKDTDGQGNKGWWHLWKFSSMGNGFTFELETLIFASLAHAVGGKIGVDSFVYGDDIIVPTTISRELLAVLRYSGFIPNERKTFTDGYFRESCGGDFLLGHDVRAYYLKEIPSEPSDWIALANGLYDLAERWQMPELQPIRAAALDNLPSGIRKLRGPTALGDLLVHDDPSKWVYRVRAGIRYFRVWRPVPTTLRLKGRRVRYVDHLGVSRSYTHIRETGVAFAAAVLGLPSTGMSPRGGVSGYRYGRVPFS